jgi:hypothetical protein
LEKSQPDERWKGMKLDNTELNQTEEENLLPQNITDEALETIGHTRKEVTGNITWAYCPSGLTICRV